MFAHLVEVVGGLSLLASRKEKEGVEPTQYLPKAIGWWLALCGKLGVKSVEDMLWDKCPSVCPYCQLERHDPNICSEKKALDPRPPWEQLTFLGKRRERPSTLGLWQVMFGSIYPAQQTEDYGLTFARLTLLPRLSKITMRQFPDS